MQQQRQYLYFCTSKASKVSTLHAAAASVFALLYQKSKKTQYLPMQRQNLNF
jgi:hypothetical protein